MINTEIDWTQNCLTRGVHNGRSDAIWNIPLNYAVIIFNRQVLKSLVVARIYNDALQIVDHNDEYSNEWASRVRELAEDKYDRTLQQKVGEITMYYNSPGWESDQESTARLVIENKLNPGYKPLHDHDTINLLCRIIGVSSAMNASRKQGE